MSEVAIDLGREPSPDHNEWLLRLRASIAVEIAEGRSLDIILDALVEAAANRIHRCEAAVITLTETGCPAVRASTLPAQIDRLIHGAHRRNWFGGWSATFNRQSEVIVPEIAASSLYREHQAILVEHGLLGSRSVDLRGRHNLVTGAFVIFLKDVRLIDEFELDIFDEIAGLAALAIRRDQHTRELLDRIRHDPLTGLENRDGLEDHLRRALANTKPDGPAVGLLFVDIDDLTLVNDSLGHTAGDAVIATTAGRIRAQLMHSDIVVRFGGDEFIVVLQDINSAADARAVAERLRQSLAEPIDINGTELATTVSIGITLGRLGTPPLQLIDEGHAAVVRAKQDGRGSTAQHDRILDTGASERLDRERQLRHGLDDGEFIIFWQPKVDLASGMVTGAEALARWAHPTHGIIGPSEFITTAERAGLNSELTNVILRKAIEEGKRLVDQYEDFSIAINLSPTQLTRADIEAVITSALENTGLKSSQLIIELTESELASPVVVERLTSLRALGVRTAIDDFGTGYSSLSYVHQLPVDIVKIDRAFIDGLESDGSGAPVLKAAVAMAQALGLTTTVEGVETSEQLAGLRELGVTWGQGYLFAEPGPMEALVLQLQSDSNHW